MTSTVAYAKAISIPLLSIPFKGFAALAGKTISLLSLKRSRQPIPLCCFGPSFESLTSQSLHSVGLLPLNSSTLSRFQRAVLICPDEINFLPTILLLASQRPHHCNKAWGHLTH